MARQTKAKKPKKSKVTAPSETVGGIVDRIALLRNFATLCEKMLWHLEDVSEECSEDVVLRMSELLENERTKSLKEVEELQNRSVA